MKRFIILILITLCMSGTLFSQDFTNQKTIRFLKLTEDEIGELEKLQDERDAIVSEAQVELNLIQAQLEKLLFPVDADLKAIELKMKESMEWRVKVELAKIRVRVESRKLLGESRWKKFLQMQKEIRKKNASEQEKQMNNREAPTNNEGNK